MLGSMKPSEATLTAGMGDKDRVKLKMVGAERICAGSVESRSD